MDPNSTKDEKMKMRFKSLLALLLFFTCSAFAFADNSPVGYWKTIDDRTHEQKSILKIRETPNHTLEGRIMKIFPPPGGDIHEVCSKCKGANYNKPFVGMVIMWGLKFDGEKWNNGQILDPKSGKVYHCYLKVVDGGNAINVHGYIGIPLLGRTQQWLRVSGV